MATSATSNVPNNTTRPTQLSYADRARRAASSSSQFPVTKARPSAPNGAAFSTRSGDESTSPASSSRNLTPSSTAALTLPGSPPPSSSQTSVDEQHAASLTSRSPAKPTQANVWAARKEQLARSTGQQQQGHASAADASTHPSQPPPPQAPVATAQQSPEGKLLGPQPDDLVPNASSKIVDDPFVVRMPPNGPARRLAASSSSPPALDDASSWPEMAKTVTASSSSAALSSMSSAADLDRKEGPSSSQKKSEKPKWVPIPQSELQATHDALLAKSNASSRTHSQQRRNHASRSRQQSQARPPSNPASRQASASGSGRGQQPSETGRQNRAASSNQSRAASLQSSPHVDARGRRLADESLSQHNSNADSSNVAAHAKNLLNGTSEQVSALFQHLGTPENTKQPHVPADPNNVPRVPHSGFPRSGPYSQTQTSFQSQSPLYYPQPQVDSGMHQYAYGMMPPNGMFGQSGGPSPRMSGGHHLPQGFPAYPPYGHPQQFSSQHPYQYFIPSVPYQFYSPQVEGQMLQRQTPDSQMRGGPDHPPFNSAATTPNVPPPSASSRPPPPSESAALSGYRDISTIPVSPLLSSSTSPNDQLQTGGSTSDSGSGDVLFGSVEPGGLKSPSPEPVHSASVAPEQREKRRSTSFAVGFDGASAVRLKVTSPSKDGTEGITEDVKIIDLTDQNSKWEFGTSSSPGEDSPQPEDAQPSALGLEATGVAEESGPSGQATPLDQPQPHHMMQFPPPQLLAPQMSGGYVLGPQMHMMSMRQGSPQAPLQPLPQHVPSLGPLPLNPGFVSPLALGSPGPTPVIPNTSNTVFNGDEWEVRDFGYGFGSSSGSGFMPERLREERLEREAMEGMHHQRDFSNGSNGFQNLRGRRNSSASSYGNYYENPRGYGRRGRGGQNGFGRGFGRGGYQGRGANHSGLPRHHQSLSVTTGPFQQIQQQQPQLSPEVPSGYYAPPPSTTTQFIPSPYAYMPPPQVQQMLQTPPQPQMQMQSQAPPPHNQHPIPLPITVLSFPLDPVRSMLLGQIEYYFSEQNLEHDDFLKSQMDLKGWIPIRVIAEFNRVKRLTQDAQLVRDVFEISSLVEIRGEHVRLANGLWIHYRPADARPSIVESDEEEGVSMGGQHSVSANGNGEEEDEEDDVVFVLGGGEESRPWAGTA